MKTMMSKNVRAALILSTLVFGTVSAPAAVSTLPDVVTATFHTGYIPDGFDTNDHVQIVGEGVFENTCYKPASTVVDIDESKKTLYVRSQAYRYDGLCLQMLVPYHQVVNVGLLKAGEYSIVEAEKGIPLGGINVHVATNAAPDDFLYAPVSQAYLESKNGENTLRIEGEFSNSCLTLKQVHVEKQKNVIVVQPISELGKENCREGKFPFEKSVKVGDIARGRYLLHVRSLNATAINNLVDVR